MKFKTTYILFGILALMLILFAVAMWNPTAPQDASLYALPSAHDAKNPFQASDVDRVEIKRVRPQEETIVFAKDPQSSRWSIVEPRKLRAGAAVGDLVNEVLNASRDAEADVPANAPAAGLEPPAEVVTLKQGDKRSVQLNVGNASSESSQAVIYVNSPERPKEIMPVQRTRLATVLDTVNQFRDPYLLASSVADYQFVKLTLDKADKKDAPKGSLVLSKKEEGLWEYKDPEGYDGAAETGDPGATPQPGKPPSGVDGLLKVLSDLQAASDAKGSDWVEDDPKDLAKYNLDPAKSDVLTIDVDRTSPDKDESGKPKVVSMKLRVGVGKKVDEKTDKYYAAVSDPEHGVSVAKVATQGLDAVALEFKDPTALRSRNLIALYGFKKPLAVDVQNASGKLEFRRETGDKPWQLYHDGKEVPVDQSAVDALVNQMVQANQVRSFINDAKPDLDKLGLSKPAAVLSLWVDGVEKEAEAKKDDKKDDKEPEKKPRLVLAKDKADRPAARLTFGAVEGEEVVVRREADHLIKQDDKDVEWKESALVKAPKLLADRATAGPLAYYDKKLSQFAEGFSPDPSLGVVKVELDREGVHYVLSRADVKPETPWKFEEPKDWANHKVDAAALEGLLSALNNLRASSLVAEQPKDEDVDKVYGLKTPTLKAVVTKDDKKAFTYEFGKDAPEGGEYARQSQRPMVFVVNKFDLAPLTKDLRDRTIFAFDPAKVKTLKLSGWQKKTGGEVLTRELERKEDKSWAVKTPPNLPMNFDKVNKLVDELSKLQAERFVSTNAVIKGEYAKEEPKGTFTVDIKVDGVDAPYVLKVVDLTGDQTLPEADRQVYATTPQFPGEVFQVRRTLFTAPPGMPQQIGPMDEAGYFSP